MSDRLQFVVPARRRAKSWRTGTHPTKLQLSDIKRFEDRSSVGTVKYDPRTHAKSTKAYVESRSKRLADENERCPEDWMLV